MADATLPCPVLAQLQAILHKYPQADRVALVWPEPIVPAESSLQLAGVSLHLVYCPSELAMRERLVQHTAGNERLVLLSPFDETRLGKDVLARLWGFEPKRISPWRTLEELLQVRQIDPRLTGKNYRWIAECLLSTYEHYRSQISFGEVLIGSEGRTPRLPTEPCVRVRTRLLTPAISIGEPQTSAATACLIE